MQTDLTTTLSNENGTELLTGFLRLAMPTANTGVTRPPIHLSIIIDCSSSMSGEPIELTKTAAASMLQWLTRRDFISIVTFSSTVNRLISHTPLTDKPNILKIISSIRAGGYTNLSGGLLEGLNDIALNYQAEHIHYAIMLTDGQANKGVTDPVQLAKIAESFKDKGINTTAFGFGPSFDENLLRNISQSGGGRFAYIADTDGIGAAFQNEFGALTSVVVQNMEVSLKTAPGIEIAEIFGEFPGNSNADSFALQLGDGLAEDTRHLLFQLRRNPDCQAWPAKPATLTFQGLDAQNSFTRISRELAVKKPTKRQSANITLEIAQELWLLQTIKLKEQVLVLADRREFAEAEQLLLTHAHRLTDIAGNRPDLVVEQQNLLEMVKRMREGSYDADFRKRTIMQGTNRQQNQGEQRRDASIEDFSASFSPQKPEKLADFVAMLKRTLAEKGFAGDSLGNAITVFSELVSNGLKHGCAGNINAKVDVICRISDTYVLFKVRDKALAAMGNSQTFTIDLPDDASHN